jgi:hypothetical protein
MELQTIGIDLGKTMLHLVGLSPPRRGRGAREVFTQATAALHRELAGRIDWHGSLRGFSFSWPGIMRPGA